MVRMGETKGSQTKHFRVGCGEELGDRVLIDGEKGRKVRESGARTTRETVDAMT